MSAGGPTRRDILRRGLLATAAFALPVWPARALEYGGRGMPWAPNRAEPPYYGTEQDVFFTASEREAADAITARLIPTDETGPGAREADVVTFIDRQLAGFYGRAQRWYMHPPFPDPQDTQGYQSPHTPSELWREGLAALDAHCRETFDGVAFASLPEETQDEILSALEEGEIEFETLSAQQFFEFAKEMTIEGFFCDPVYGGNRDMIGWRLVGFPGARYDYRDFLRHDGARLDIAPVSLVGAPAWNRNSP